MTGEKRCPVDACPQGGRPYGLLDCAGNVWEWTISLWGEWTGEEARLQFRYPYDRTDGREDTEAGDDIFRVLRGSSWRHAQRAATAACRHEWYPLARHDIFGFRCCMAAEQRQGEEQIGPGWQDA